MADLDIHCRRRRAHTMCTLVGYGERRWMAANALIVGIEMRLWTKQVTAETETNIWIAFVNCEVNVCGFLAKFSLWVHSK